MPEGPLGGPRPFAEPVAEVNVSFVGRDVTDEMIDKVEDKVEEKIDLSGPVKGPVGELNNTVTFTLTGNQLTLSSLDRFKKEVERSTGESVRDIEVII